MQPVYQQSGNRPVERTASASLEVRAIANGRTGSPSYGCALLLVACLSHSAAAQEGIVVQDVQWGFDGKTTERTFTPLSVLVQNNSAEAITGKLRLIKAVQLNQQIDAVYEQDYFVSGFSSRWVQFTPFVISDFESWRLEWGPGRDQRMEVPTPRNGDPATVLVYDPEDLPEAGGVLRRFDQALFPVSVTGTDSLRGVVLDHVPDWQGARVQAFLDWLRRGGRVYVVYNSEGEYPRFPESLGVLNRPDDRYRVGGGLVKRLPLKAADIDFSTAQSQVLADERQSLPRQVRAAVQTSPFGNLMGWDRDRQLFVDLEIAARFHRNWWLVYPAVLLYLVAMYPGCYQLGRKLPDWRMFYAAFFGTAVLFSFAFAWLSRVGTTETNRVRTLALAYQLEDGLYDVTQWSSVAALHGRTYDIRHGGSGRLYTTAQEFEAVNGTIHGADGGGVEVDMPPSSSRTLLHRTRLPGPKLNLQVNEVQVDEQGLSRLSVTPQGRDFRGFESACACYQGQVYDLAEAPGDGLILKGRGRPAPMYLMQFGEDVYSTRGWRVQDDEVFDDEEILFHNMARTLVGNSFRLQHQFQAEDLLLGEDLVRICIYADLTPAFRVQGDDFPDQRGRVLYVIDVPVR